MQVNCCCLRTVVDGCTGAMALPVGIVGYWWLFWVNGCPLPQCTQHCFTKAYQCRCRLQY